MWQIEHWLVNSFLLKTLKCWWIRLSTNSSNCVWQKQKRTDRNKTLKIDLEKTFPKTCSNIEVVTLFKACYNFVWLEHLQCRQRFCLRLLYLFVLQVNRNWHCTGSTTFLGLWVQSFHSLCFCPFSFSLIIFKLLPK